MTSVVAVAYSHPTATKRDVHDLLWTKVQVIAARKGLEATDMTAHSTRETYDGLIEHRALFTVKELT